MLADPIGPVGPPLLESDSTILLNSSGTAHPILATPYETEDAHVIALSRMTSVPDSFVTSLSRHKAQRENPVPTMFEERVSVDNPPSRHETDDMRRGS